MTKNDSRRAARPLVLLAFLASGSALAGDALVLDSWCYTNTLAANDDDSTDLIGLPFSINFFGEVYSALYVNNNGNLSFTEPMWTYTPFDIVTTGIPIVAPFFANVDTRANSGLVHYGSTDDYQGRPAFCATWSNVATGVNYYYAYDHNDNWNRFQTILVDRTDRGAGDFDIVFNYDEIQWETGDASGGTDGLGGDSARVGYSNGDSSTPETSFELPGSAVNGAFLDSSPSGLIRSSRNSFVLGRYIFPVENGLAASGGAISGTAKAPWGSGWTAVPGAPVEACVAGETIWCPWAGTSDASGGYSASGLESATYDIRAFPPSGSVALPATRLGVEFDSAVDLTGQDLYFYEPVLPPAETGIEPSRSGGGGVPSVYWNDTLTLTGTGCAGGTASYAITQDEGAIFIDVGGMTEVPAGSGIYRATVPPFYPYSGSATIDIFVECPDATEEVVSFDIYIDPSGRVTDPYGDPIYAATVSLFRSDTGASGSFVQVPDGSSIMSPSNRSNPMFTDESGQYGWDVLVGYYVVRAEKEGCLGADGAPYVESDVLEIPPPAFDVDLVLVCEDGDADDDGVADDADNCPDVANPDQVDLDADGLGDACDDDLDGDGTPNETDNCPSTVNVDQADSDADGMGDVCDPDDDDDGILDAVDNCPFLWNEDQADLDGDGQGDECDGDDDSDGVDDETDLCAATPLDVAVSANGCSGALYIALTCGSPSDHKNHGQYVSCVTRAANDAVTQGLITATEKAAFVRAAAKK